MLSTRQGFYKTSIEYTEISPRAMVFEMNTLASVGTRIALPTLPIGSGMPYQDANSFTELLIDWGDGTIEEFYSDYSTNTIKRPFHVYSQPGTYVVQVSPTKRCLSDANGLWGIDAKEYSAPVTTIGDQRIAPFSILSWGTGNQPKTINFQGYTGLSSIPDTQSPDLSNFPSLSRMFFGITSFVGDSQMTQWDTSNVIDMSEMFRNCVSFNIDISSWNTGNVTSMRQMFQNALAFDQPIGSWNTGKVNDMSHMFENTQFNQPVNAWDTSSVTNMSTMFKNNTVFDQNLDSWDTSLVTNFFGMFDGAVSFQGDVGPWITDSATNMAFMFKDTRMNSNIALWNTSNVTNMASMFENVVVFDQPIGDWNTGNVTSMARMFSGPDVDWTEVCARFRSAFYSNNNWPAGTGWPYLITDSPQGSSGPTSPPTTKPFISNGWAANHNIPGSPWNNKMLFNQPVGNWNTSNVTDMSYMFNNCIYFDQDLTDWNTSKVTNMESMFRQTMRFEDTVVSGEDVGRTAGKPAYYRQAIQKGFRNGAVFHNLSQGRALTAEVGNGAWNTGNVTNMSGMFEYTAFTNTVDGFDTSNVTDMSNMFRGIPLVETLIQTPFALVGSGTFPNNTNFYDPSYSFLFSGLDIFYEADTVQQAGGPLGTQTPPPLGSSTFDTSNVTNISGMFEYTGPDVVTTHTTPAAGITNTSAVTNMENALRYAINSPAQTYVNLWDTGNVTNMNGLFEFCNNIDDITSWDTSSVVAGTPVSQSNVSIEIGDWNRRRIDASTGQAPGAPLNPVFRKVSANTPRFDSNINDTVDTSYLLLFERPAGISSGDNITFEDLPSNIAGAFSQYGIITIDSFYVEFVPTKWYGDPYNFDTTFQYGQYTNFNWLCKLYFRSNLYGNRYWAFNPSISDTTLPSTVKWRYSPRARSYTGGLRRMFGNSDITQDLTGWDTLNKGYEKFGNNGTVTTTPPPGFNSVDLTGTWDSTSSWTSKPNF